MSLQFSGNCSLLKNWLTCVMIGVGGARARWGVWAECWVRIRVGDEIETCHRLSSLAELNLSSLNELLKWVLKSKKGRFLCFWWMVSAWTHARLQNNSRFSQVLQSRDCVLYLLQNFTVISYYCSLDLYQSKMSSLPIPLSCLTSLSQSLQPLTSLLNSPSPPPFIYLHSPSNPFLTSQLIQQLLSQPYSSGDAPQLPRFAYADLLEIHNSRSLYDRLLNRLAAWTPEWTPAGCPSWNGQTQGLRLISSNSSLISQDQSSTDLSLSALAWDYDLNPDESPRLGLVNKKNESFDAFCDGLRTLSSLTYTYLDQVAIPVAQRPKFIIIDRASRLRDWKDVNLMAAFSRLPEIVGDVYCFLLDL